MKPVFKYVGTGLIALKVFYLGVLYHDIKTTPTRRKIENSLTREQQKNDRLEDKLKELEKKNEKLEMIENNYNKLVNYVEIYIEKSSDHHNSSL